MTPHEARDMACAVFDEVIGLHTKLDKSGLGECPFCQQGMKEVEPKFRVDRGSHYWRCFGCEKRGDLFAFIIEAYGFDIHQAVDEVVRVYEERVRR